MSLLLVYAVLVLGDVIAYLVGLAIQRHARAASPPALLAMYFPLPVARLDPSECESRSRGQRGVAGVPAILLTQNPAALRDSRTVGESMPRFHRIARRLVVLAALTSTIGACSSDPDTSSVLSGAILKRPDWATFSGAKTEFTF